MNLCAALCSSAEQLLQKYQITKNKFLPRNVEQKQQALFIIQNSELK